MKDENIEMKWYEAMTNCEVLTGKWSRREEGKWQKAMEGNEGNELKTEISISNEHWRKSNIDGIIVNDMKSEKYEKPKKKKRRKRGGEKISAWTKINMSRN